MRNFISLLCLIVFACNIQAQEVNQHQVLSDSEVMKTTIYYSKDQGEWIEPDFYTTIAKFLRWAQSDTTTPIVITGWTDPSGSEVVNNKLSLRRARTVRNYLVQMGISSERISFEGRGVDKVAVSYDKARRADVCGVIRLTSEVQPKEDVREVAAAPTVVEEKETQQPYAELIEEPVKQEPIAEPIQEQTVLNHHQCWYAGLEGGTSLGVSDFSSFAHQGKLGYTVGVLAGYCFSTLLSIEVSAVFGKLRLGANHCCEDYWLGGDGARYLASVAGINSYSYRDICSFVSVQQYALRLNVDMLQIVRPDWDKRWSLTVSPAVYGIDTKASIKNNNTTIAKHGSQFNFGAGAGIGVSYQITRNLGIGVRLAMAWVFDDHYDGITPTQHRENMMWNNTATLMWRFGK